MFKKIWDLALPYLKSGKKKSFVVHTEGVIRAMTLLLDEWDEDPNILIPAAILHDVGWSKVPQNLQMNFDKKSDLKALKLHLEFAPSIINEILCQVGYKERAIIRITQIVLAHKFQNPIEIDKQLLIDADTLSDAFKKQFYSDVKAYKTTPEQLYKFRKNNQFYTNKAKIFFDKEIEERMHEFRSKQ